LSDVRLGVDVGGTFTDLVAIAEGKLVTAKVLSTPDQSEGVMRAIDQTGLETAEVSALAHGMTVATNALLERRGARTALVTTEGFRDVIEIGRQNRPALYDLTEDRPPSLVPRDLRLVVRERTGPDGEIEPLDEESVEQAIAGLKRAEVESAAVCLLFGFLHPEHERAVGEAVRKSLPDAHVSLACEILPEFREYERMATTTANAYLAPKLSNYLNNLGRKARAAGLPAPLVMRSSGGVMDIEAAAARPTACILSGPAAGVVGAAHIARASGHEDVLTFDMGGTSTDVAPVVGGQIQTTTETIVAGVPIKLPMVDVHSVSAGGGSMAWADEGGILRVGPRSAGADPGPASYGRGGTEPTVTDANLHLGYLADGARLGDEVVLERARAEKALEELGSELGMDAFSTATGVVEVANAEMVKALRVISIERGLDPRDFTLVAFGGAGPMHACALAEELGITTVLVPKASGVLSALGLAISDERRDYVSPLIGDLDWLDKADLDAAFRPLEETAERELASPRLERRADLRYRGQSFELTVDAGDHSALGARFHATHEARYGYRMDDEPVEVVNVRLIATSPVEKPSLQDAGPSVEQEKATRSAVLGGERIDVVVLDRSKMGSGSKIEGPALIEFPESTCVVPPGWRGEVDDGGSLVLEKPDG
jgi:N-methylhydantoinase A